MLLERHAAKLVPDDNDDTNDEKNDDTDIIEATDDNDEDEDPTDSENQQIRATGSIFDENEIQQIRAIHARGRINDLMEDSESDDDECSELIDYYSTDEENESDE